MKSRIILALALIMGAFTTFLFVQYVQQFKAAEAVNDSVVDVVVAKHPIVENQIITSDMLEIIRVTENNLHANTVHSMNEVVGHFAITTIEEGEILLSHRTKSDKEEMTLVSRKVQEGYRAVSVNADFVRSVSNLIEPEDYVDVILTETVATNENDTELQSTLIFSEVRVLAVGRKMLPPVNDQVTYMEYSSVTLELEPEEATKLINSAEKGNIHFTLHSSITSEDEKEKD
ncbi:pilus assembly protein CpaB [Evansella vedderi]|uniref:Pilus assembly protein CpaB n=1 Tax=Evansella vedderi TaxID=38282 RepID=A0ABU0A0H0_9BACI|nr:Flp pilus assembly protein CpaB [Evansella vedderi]MDQ0256984.1 pilus assembly protein CpaB [Evansella vedderi]